MASPLFGCGGIFFRGSGSLLVIVVQQLVTALVLSEEINGIFMSFLSTVSTQSQNMLFILIDFSNIYMNAPYVALCRYVCVYMYIFERTRV